MNFKIKEEKKAYDGFLKINTLLIEHDKSDGGKVVIKRELMKGGSAACIFLYDKKIEKALLVKQFRVGAIYNEDGAWTEEIVAGLIDEGEEPIDAIIRECKEESGLDLNKKNVKLISKTHPSIGISNKMLYIFVAETDLSSVDLSKTYGTCEQEDIRLFLKDLSELKERALNGEIHYLPQLNAIQYLIINQII